MVLVVEHGGGGGRWCCGAAAAYDDGRVDVISSPPPAPPPPNPGPETLKLCQNPMVVKGRVSLNPQTLERRLLTLAAEYLSPKKLNLLKLQ